MPVAVLADPFRLPGGPNPEPRHGRGRPLPPPANAGQGSGVDGGKAGKPARRRNEPPPVPKLPGPGPFTHREYLDLALEAFVREHPNIRVRVVMLPAAEAGRRLQQALADGKPPDVFGGWGGALVVGHPLQVPLDPYLRRAERRWYHPTALALYRAGRRHWIWPRWVAPHAWWADAARVRAAGLDPDRLAREGWTLEDAERVARAAAPRPGGAGGGPAGGAGRGGDAGDPGAQGDGKAGGLVLWASRPDLPLHQLLRARQVPAPLAAQGTVLWAGPEGQAVLDWLEGMREAGLLQAVGGEQGEAFLAGDGAGTSLAGGFTPGLSRWLLERRLGIRPERKGRPVVEPGQEAAWAAPPGWAGDGARDEGTQDPALVPPGFEGLVLLPPPVPAGQPRPALVEVGGLAVFRQESYKGAEHTQAAVELARFLSRWRTDVLTRRALAVPADVTSLQAWRQEFPLPETYRRQLEHLSLGVINPDRRGRPQRLAVAFPVDPAAGEPELGVLARKVWPPLAEFWAGRREAASVIRAWGGPLTPPPP